MQIGEEGKGQEERRAGKEKGWKTDQEKLKGRRMGS